MAQRLNGRATRAALATGPWALVAGLALAGCANSDAAQLVTRACTHVQQSLNLMRQAALPGTSAAAQQRDQAAALLQLRAALPLAAQAAGEASQWQAFMTTLSESSRVPESDLVEALTQQCAGSGTAPAPGSGPPSTTTTAGPVATLPTVGR